MSVEKQKYIVLDGQLVPWDEANVHVLTHGLHYGSAVFEGTRFYPDKAQEGQLNIFRLPDHINRLFYSAKFYRMEEVLPSSEDLTSLTLELIRECQIHTGGYIRHLVWRGEMFETERGKGAFGMNPLPAAPRYCIAAFPFGAYLGKDAIERGARCIFSSWERISPRALPPSVKCAANYVNSQLAKLEAITRGYHEAIFLDHLGRVSEGSGENIFWVKEGKIGTPPFDASILPGITRDSIMQLASDFHLTMEEYNITKAGLLQTDEVFFTGTAGEVTPVTEIDDQNIGDGTVGPITRKLQNKFFDVVNGLDKTYSHWLSPVYIDTDPAPDVIHL